MSLEASQPDRLRIYPESFLRRPLNNIFTRIWSELSNSDTVPHVFNNIETQTCQIKKYSIIGTSNGLTKILEVEGENKYGVGKLEMTSTGNLRYSGAYDPYYGRSDIGILHIIRSVGKKTVRINHERFTRNPKTSVNEIPLWQDTVEVGLEDGFTLDQLIQVKRAIAEIKRFVKPITGAPGDRNT